MTLSDVQIGNKVQLRKLRHFCSAISRRHVLPHLGTKCHGASHISIMHSGVMDTVFHSCDALDSMPQNLVLKYPQFFVQNELNIVLC